MTRLLGDREREPSAVRWPVAGSLIFLCVLIMLPRLLSPRFGLFDDGNTMLTVQRIVSGEWRFFHIPWEVAAGRIRPTYWLLPLGIDLAVGKNPFWFYVANTALLGITTGGICRLVALTGGSRLRAAMTGLLFAVAGPVVESYYTLSKGEALQVACIVGSLLAAVSWARTHTRLGRFGWLLGMTVMIFLGLGAKETGVAILPVSALWALLGTRRAEADEVRKGLGGRGAYFAAALIASAAFLGLTVWSRGTMLMRGGYSTSYALSPASLASVLTRWSGWIIRDFGYLLPLGLAVVALWAFRRPHALNRSLIDSLIWMGGWVVVFLPWARYTVEYYLLPFAVGAAAFGAAAAEETLKSIPGAGRGWKTFSVVCLVLAAGLWLMTIATNVSNARVQLAVDSANADVLEYIAAQAPAHSQILVNIQNPNEYVDEFGMNLTEFYGRRDLSTGPIRISEPNLGATGQGAVLIAVPEVENSPKLTVRMGVIDATQRSWNDALDGSLRNHANEVFRTGRSFRLVTFDSPRLLCGWLARTGYCSEASPLIDTRLFSYGWRVYRFG